MVEQKEWVFYKDIDFMDGYFNQFNIDTRDFCSGYTKKKHPDYDTLKKYPHFFHSLDELKSLLDRYFEQSGGVGEWRMLDLDVKYPRVNNWKLKYIRIFRTDLGFIICNSDYKALDKDILSNNVDLRYLNKY
jgi:hypothetical protein